MLFRSTGSIASVAEVNSGTNISSALVFKSGSVGVLTEGMRLNKDQQLLIGTDTVNPQSGSSNAGVQIGEGHIYAGKSGNACAILNRQTSDGSIVALRKNGSTIGQLGTYDGYLSVGSGDCYVLFNPSENALLPASTETAGSSDNFISLGSASRRFKHLSLGGGVYVGSGSESAPTITFDADTNTGIYRIAENRMGFVTGGVKAAEIDSSGNTYHFGRTFLRPSTVANAIRSANGTLVVEATEGQLQVIADNGGDWAANIVMSNEIGRAHV